EERERAVGDQVLEPQPALGGGLGARAEREEEGTGEREGGGEAKRAMSHGDLPGRSVRPAYGNRRGGRGLRERRGTGGRGRLPRGRSGPRRGSAPRGGQRIADMPVAS